MFALASAYRSGAVSAHGGVLAFGCPAEVVAGAKFLTDFARDMLNRVFEYNFSPERSMVGMGETRSMAGMTLSAIPTVQSQKSLGFSMPKRERYRAAFSKRGQLPRKKLQPAR